MKDLYQHGYVRKDRYVKTETGLRKIIKRVAEAHGFEISPNAEKIINAKLNMCRGDFKRCPCSHEAGSPRYCGSPFCAKETREKGKCLCGLFILKNKKDEI